MSTVAYVLKQNSPAETAQIQQMSGWVYFRKDHHPCILRWEFTLDQKLRNRWLTSTDVSTCIQTVEAARAGNDRLIAPSPYSRKDLQHYLNSDFRSTCKAVVPRLNMIFRHESTSAGRAKLSAELVTHSVDLRLFAIIEGSAAAVHPVVIVYLL